MFRIAFKGFVAGAIATLVFHQAFIWLLSFFLPFPFKPWNMAINSYGVPSALALTFWGGVWGIPLCLLVAPMLRIPALLTGAVLGGVLPSVWGWTVLAAMKGQPMFAGGKPNVILMVLLINAVWGIATVALYRAMGRGDAKAKRRRRLVS